MLIFFYVTAPGDLYSAIYITIYSPNLIIFPYWTQLLEYRAHGTINLKPQCLDVCMYVCIYLRSLKLTKTFINEKFV